MDRIQMAQSGMSLEEIAEAEGVIPSAIRNWLYRRGLTYQLLKPANYETVPAGYERWHHKHECQPYYCSVHRLAAVAWFGYEAVTDRHVHHENGIPWDNREENLRVLTPSEHAAEHAPDTLLEQDFDKRERAATGEFINSS
jgi:hypothetical protein